MDKLGFRVDTQRTDAASYIPWKDFLLLNETHHRSFAFDDHVGSDEVCF